MSDYDMWVETVDGVRVEHPADIKYPSNLDTWVATALSTATKPEVLVTVWRHSRGENRKKFYSEKCWSIDLLALEMFEKLCKEHDWYYAYSDDHNVWKRGVVAEDRLKARYAALRKTDIGASVEAIWNQYNPSGF